MDPCTKHNKSDGPVANSDSVSTFLCQMSLSHYGRGAAGQDCADSELQRIVRHAISCALKFGGTFSVLKRYGVQEVSCDLDNSGEDNTPSAPQSAHLSTLA